MSPKGRAAKWRSFVPHGQSAVRFQSVRPSDIRLSRRVDVVNHLMLSRMSRFVKHTRQHIIFVYGAPREEYKTLSHVCRVCWIYDIEWDDDLTAEFHNYVSVEEAARMCTKFQQNVCGTIKWMTHLEGKDYMICILDDEVVPKIGSSAYTHINLTKFMIHASLSLQRLMQTLVLNHSYWQLE